ncbi:hypothetical protein PSTT_14268 [Puccinia striiformis]|uniref:Hydrophobin n=1 Tax=Puccinia striiformis TaxID=27350 RepID=A0A2S4UNC8_9BASI|nr:hypothetical protein PSTT_14268 [Puccinia striiformis]
MCSTKFILLLIAITLAGGAVHAAELALHTSEFPCPDPKKTKAMCLQTTAKSVKQMTDYWLIPANLAALIPGSLPQYTCVLNRQGFQSGFHDTCCSKDLDLKKFPQSDHLSKLDRETFDKFCTDLTPS